jgi:hypothetical protein
MAQSNGRVNIDEYGDFQTPFTLAAEVCGLLAIRGEVPAAVVEPTCGVGNFLVAAFEQFPELVKAIGIEINNEYVKRVDDVVRDRPYAARINVIRESFFKVDWRQIFSDLPEPILVVGNPPWVTNAALGVVGSSNLPKKSNFQRRGGLDARTGKSNFDISEWMLIELLESLHGRRATLAMLCKTAVARKVLTHVWTSEISLCDAEIRRVDAATHFDAAVDACLLTCSLSKARHQQDCPVYRRLGDCKAATVIGFRDNVLLANVFAYDRWKHLAGGEIYKWRSGVKHDCSKVMELERDGNRYRNGLGAVCELESDFVYPMLKSSQIANASSPVPSRWMLVTQQALGADPTIIQETAPATWAYLERHADLLDRRASSIYRGRARFSVFGVGDYTFSPWKVAISGFYKQLNFSVVGSFAGKPIILDDTCYFVSCQSEEEACYVASVFNSAPARDFLSAYIFWDAKRPVTIETLRRLDVAALSLELGHTDNFSQFARSRRLNISFNLPSVSACRAD